MTAIPDHRIDLYSLDATGLETLLGGWGEPAFRARQIWDWLYVQRAPDFDSMRNVPKSLRERLKTETRMGVLELAAEQESSDGTIKRLYRLVDGQLIESVLMEYDDERRTACISTQAGCAMGCVFCATGQMGFARHLTADEIFEQAIYFARELAARGERLSNVVLMGMGEPFHNYDASIEAVRRLMRDLDLGARHITVSTVGLVPMIRRFADEGLQVKLAVSLHAATDDERGALLPVNRRYPLKELIGACYEYVHKTGRRISFEWTLIEGQNDTPEQAHALGKLLRGLKCHVNAIPLNPTPGYGGDPSASRHAEAFRQVLESYGVSMTVRVRRGIDINAGCGQLKSVVLERRRKRSEDALPEETGDQLDGDLGGSVAGIENRVDLNDVE
ncbi:MAG: 23S rRNA (adenine(2503)-C(2))-methyltransferase RlmN [Anaerolineae bacterium]